LEPFKAFFADIVRWVIGGVGMLVERKKWMVLAQLLEGVSAGRTYYENSH
jgi:hypothetical protein